MKKITFLSMLITMCFLTGCKEVTIIEKRNPTEAQYVSAKDIELNTFYVKDGTKFSKTYFPKSCNLHKVNYLDKSRVIYFTGDKKMVPTHYKGEILAYASQNASIKELILERFMYLGYSFGFYGGKLKDDGYLHISAKNNTIKGTSAGDLFRAAISDEIRIVSIGGVAVSDILDKESGVVLGAEENGKYAVEYYSGTYYYVSAITADTEFLRAFEIMKYGTENVRDTQNGYKCFDTPTDLKTGYYLVNGEGLFEYVACKKGEEVAERDYNEPYYKTEEDAIAAYSKVYTVTFDTEKEDIRIKAVCEKGDLKGVIVSPAGETTELAVTDNTLFCDFLHVMAGTYKLYIENGITVKEVKTESCVEKEEMVNNSRIYVAEKSQEYFYLKVPVYGSGKVTGYFINSSGETVLLSEINNKEERYLEAKIPFLEKGTYTLCVYHYESDSVIGEIETEKYSP